MEERLVDESGLCGSAEEPTRISATDDQFLFSDVLQQICDACGLQVDTANPSPDHPNFGCVVPEETGHDVHSVCEAEEFDFTDVEKMCETWADDVRTRCVEEDSSE